ncbi:glycosyltransferase family 2 protein [Chryseobacterium koreense]|uniref:glycosyltransferase family 2 protein n=1 Tax=Chryseobacterium koreense TaxID=232216 RepID=UPI00065AFC94|nr:glycosyltransferase family A protein [Chryseobacterium koreense]MBB5333546.1 glycosyltransferase involved in cell wall biosynthesis [Chryseobacterium koreense]
MEVTVVIPVYNAEKYLDECVQSVLNQNFTDFEILLINDGSSDGSGIICENYASKDSRVKVFHKKNGGVSTARNMGIEYAKGKWITFIDADDYIQENYFEVLNLKNDTDWILLDIKRDVFSDMGVGMDFENQVYEAAEFVNIYSLYPHFPEACAKFFKNSIVKKSNLRFNTDLKFGEDSLFNLQYLKFCQIISTTNISKYIYRNGGGGLSKLIQDIKNDTTLFQEIEKELEKHQYPVQFCQQTIRIPLTRYLKVLYSDKSISPANRLLLLRRNVEKYYNVCLTVFTNPKIRLFFAFARLTGFYCILDQVLSKLNK